MNNQSIIVELVKLFAFSGGFGYISYFVLKKEGVINRADSDEERVFFVILFSIVNVQIFEVISPYVLKNVLQFDIRSWIVESLIIFIISLVIAFMALEFFRRYIPKLYLYINKNRQKSNLSEIDDKKLINELIDFDKVVEAYIFDIITDKLLACGNVHAVDQYSSFPNIILSPFIVGTPRYEIKNYDILISQLKQESKESLIYIDFINKIKIVVTYF